MFTVKGLKKNPDYVIKKNNTSTVIEVGGAGKTGAQLRGFQDSIVIKGNQLISLLLI